MDETEKDKFAGWLALPSSHFSTFCFVSLNVFVDWVCVCVQVRRWSSSALEKVFSTTPSRATTPVSLPMDRPVINNQQLVDGAK